MNKNHRVIYGWVFLLLLVFLSSCSTSQARADISAGTFRPDDLSDSLTTIENETTATEGINLQNSDQGSSSSNEEISAEPLLKEASLNDDSNSTADPCVPGSDDFIEDELKSLMSEFGEDADEVPQVFLDEVKGYIRIFQKNPQYRKFVTTSLKRSAKYMTMVKEIFTKRGIPEDMTYIAFIESGFNPRALSSAGALGMWQFIPGTARNYSLKVGRNMDERLDPVKSTYAAVDYFHDLLAIFGPKSFLLAMAAYNSGENRIISCLKGIDDPFEDRTFWHIRPCLSKETREYPPKIIAASIIGSNPKAFGFPEFEIEDFISEEPLTLVDNRDTKVKGYSVSNQMTAEKKKSGFKTSQKKEKAGPLFYTVKKGNSLEDIAGIFRVEKNDIRKWNNMKSGKLLSGKKLKIYVNTPVELVRYKVRKGDTISEISDSFNVRSSQIIICSGLSKGGYIQAGQTLTFYKAVEKKPLLHLVKKGSNLKNISEKYQVSVKKIMMWNNMTSTIVYAGQKLKIYSKDPQDA